MGIGEAEQPFLEVTALVQVGRDWDLCGLWLAANWTCAVGCSLVGAISYYRS